jgi:hypothetical protein
MKDDPKMTGLFEIFLPYARKIWRWTPMSVMLTTLLSKDWYVYVSLVITLTIKLSFF